MQQAVEARIIQGDALDVLRTLPAESVQCVVTSPPYFGLRDYGTSGQIGLEATPEKYLARVVDVFRELRRILKADGTLWVNMGDSYAGGGKGGNPPESDHQKQATNRGSLLHAGFHESARLAGVVDRSWQKPPPGYKAKDLMGMPWRLAFALQADGWYLRQDIIWHKPNPMPESVTDRCTKAHEYVFLLSKSERYFYDAAAIAEPNSEDVQRTIEKWKDDPRVAEARKKGNIGSAPDRADSEKTLRIRNGAFANPNGRNKRSVWTITTEPYPEAHFATFPTELPRICILAGTRVGDTVLDPFAGSGTTLQVALELSRASIGIELNEEYVALANRRLNGTTLGLPLEVAA